MKRTKTIRMAKTIFLAAACCLAWITGMACATTGQHGPHFTATATAEGFNSDGTALPRTESAEKAAIAARDDLMLQVLAMQAPDGRPLEVWAVEDATVRAKLRDVVRAAHLTYSEFSSQDGGATVTMVLELQPIYDFLAKYPAP